MKLLGLSSSALRVFSSAFLASAALMMSSCKTTPPPPPVEEEKKDGTPKPLYEWSGNKRAATHLRIDIDKQKVFVFSGEEQIGWATVATGLRSFPTPTGSFKVLEKTADKKSNLYGKAYNSSGKVTNSDAKMGRDAIPEGGRFEGARMPYYMRLTGDGVGMHAGPIPRPGSRASHGCIRLPRAFAPVLFASVSVGTPVSIEGDGPDYASYIKKQNAAASRLAASRAAKRKDAEAKAAAEGATLPGAAVSVEAAAAAPGTAPTTPATPPVEIKPAEPPASVPAPAAEPPKQ